jgi:hypothetical protein
MNKRCIKCGYQVNHWQHMRVCDEQEIKIQIETDECVFIENVEE